MSTACTAATFDGSGCRGTITDGQCGEQDDHHPTPGMLPYDGPGAGQADTVQARDVRPLPPEVVAVVDAAERLMVEWFDKPLSSGPRALGDTVRALPEGWRDGAALVGPQDIHGITVDDVPDFVASVMRICVELDIDTHDDGWADEIIARAAVPDTVQAPAPSEVEDAVQVLSRAEAHGGCTQEVADAIGVLLAERDTVQASDGPDFDETAALIHSTIERVGGHCIDGEGYQLCRHLAREIRSALAEPSAVKR